LTKHVSAHDEALKNQLTIEDAKVEIVPKMIDSSMAIGGSHIVRKPKSKMKVSMVKSKVPVKRTSRLEKAIQHLYDLEEAHEREKPLNIDFGLYQMEDY
jgi:succinate dehydrogenase/fumarate reductase flavoprotein subunit